MTKPNVLVIEDDDSHYAAIEAHLTEAGFLPERLASVNKERLFNYKAIHRESNIIVVDMILDESAKIQFNEGLALIRDELWPVDRTTFFVVFSRLEPDSRPSLPLTIEPHWCYVAKSEDPSTKKLEQRCLDDLVTVLTGALRNTPAYFEPPRYEVLKMLKEYDSYRSNSKSVNPATGPRDSIIDSIEILDKLSRGSTDYARAGSITNHVTLGVFGSCGRLELRRTSDIELAAYFTKDIEGLAKALAVMLWNRAIKMIENEQWQFEGAKLLAKNSDALLHVDQIDEDLRNRFLPVMNCEGILSANLKLEPHIRNRHLQILTEARPIFNATLLTDLKVRLIAQNVGGGYENLWTTIGSTYFQDLFTQFFVDLRPSTLSSTHDYKDLVLRVFNQIILRMEFVRQLCTKEATLSTFLEDIVDPGIIKLARFANFCRQKIKSAKAGTDLDSIIQNYSTVWSMFDVERKLQADLRSLGERMCEFLGKLKIQNELTFISNSSCDWIWSTEPVERLLREL